MLRHQCHAERSEASPPRRRPFEEFTLSVTTVLRVTGRPHQCHAERCEASLSSPQTFRCAQHDTGWQLRLMHITANFPAYSGFPAYTNPFT